MTTVKNPSEIKPSSRALRPVGHLGKPWTILVFLAVAFTLLPLLALTWQATGNSDGVWAHLIANVLPQSLAVTFTLLIGVGLGTFIVGSGTAWLVSRYQFPLRNTLQWALILPLAVPTYISAYTWTEFAGYTGPLQEWTRILGGFETSRDYWFPDIRSTTGAVLLISLVLFPYVYLPSRLSFSVQSSNLFDVARLLGAGPIRLFLRVALPAARPAIAIGVILALMETMNDIGAVEHLGVRTLTFSVFDTWLNRSSLAGAAQLSLLLMVLVFGLMAMERHMRSKQSYHGRSQSNAIQDRISLTGAKAFTACIACLLPVLLGFGVPLFQLLHFTFASPAQLGDTALYSAAINSINVAIASALICILAAFVIVYAARRSSSPLYIHASQISTLGYAVPGTILGLGILVAMTSFDNWMSSWMQSFFDIRTGLLISGSLAIVIFACSVRFLAIAIGNIEAGYAKITPNISEAARTLGHSRASALWFVELPMISKAAGIAGVLVFVESMKELSATLLLRPFNFDTLSTYVYTRASRAVFEEASVAALMIVLIGLVPVYVLTTMIISEQNAKSR